MKLFQIFIFINIFFLTNSQEYYDIRLDEALFENSEEKCENYLSHYNLSFSKSKWGEYMKNPNILTLFRLNDERFYCETNCPFGMMAGCYYEKENGSSFECEELKLPNNSLCSPPLPYLLHTNLNKSFEQSWLTLTHIENPPYTNISSDFSKKCSRNKDCPNGYYCSHIYHMGNDREFRGKDDGFCMELPTQNAKNFGDLKICDKSEDCYGETSTCNKNSYEMNDEYKKGFCEIEEMCRIGVSTKTPFQKCRDQTHCPIGSWCDFDEQICCKEDKNILRAAFYCPDDITPLQQEPNCTKIDETYTCDLNVWGIKREKPGICWAGRCCPNLKKLAKDQFEIGTFPYESNMPCDPNETLPLKYTYKWCDSETWKIYTIGLLDYEKQRIQSSQWNCRISSDCKGEREICLNVSERRRVCYKSPIKKFESTVQLRFYLSLGFPFLTLFALIIASGYYL